MSLPNSFDREVGKRKNLYRHDPGSYDYSGLAHWWAYNYGYKTTGQGRMTADGNRIKSYSTVIGRMFDPVKKGAQPFVLLASGRYSNTTATHMSAIHSAVSHMDYMFIADPDPFGRDDHISNLRVILSSLEHLASEYPKKRKDTTREAVLSGMVNNKKNAEKYASYFKVKNTSEYKQIKKFPMPTDENFEELFEQTIKDKMAAAARLKAKKARARKKENEKNAAIAKGRLERWLKGEDVYVDSRYLEKVYLRIKNNLIETTESAHIGLIDAVKAYIRLKKGTLKEGMHIGPYVYGGIDEMKNIHVGCHVIPLEDVDIMIGTVIAEKEAYMEDDQRRRDAEYEAEQNVSLGELFGELAQLVGGLDDAIEELGFETTEEK
jgi:flagellin-specific chaperone FliS